MKKYNPILALLMLVCCTLFHQIAQARFPTPEESDAMGRQMFSDIGRMVDLHRLVQDLSLHTFNIPGSFPLVHAFAEDTFFTQDQEDNFDLKDDNGNVVLALPHGDIVTWGAAGRIPFLDDWATIRLYLIGKSAWLETPYWECNDRRCVKSGEKKHDYGTILFAGAGLSLKQYAHLDVGYVYSSFSTDYSGKTKSTTDGMLLQFGIPIIGLYNSLNTYDSMKLSRNATDLSMSKNQVYKYIWEYLGDHFRIFYNPQFNYEIVDSNYYNALNSGFWHVVQFKDPALLGICILPNKPDGTQNADISSTMPPTPLLLLGMPFEIQYNVSNAIGRYLAFGLSLESSGTLFSDITVEASAPFLKFSHSSSVNGVGPNWGYQFGIKVKAIKYSEGIGTYSRFTWTWEKDFAPLVYSSPSRAGYGSMTIGLDLGIKW